MKIVKTKSGKYTTQISLRDLEGKRHVKRFTADTKIAVQQMAVEFQTNHTVYISSNAFTDALRRFLDESDKVLSPSTMRGYRSIQRSLEAYEKFMNTPIDRIDHVTLQSLMDVIRSERSQKTTRNYLGLISAVMSNEGYRVPLVKIRKGIPTQTVTPDADMIKKVAEVARGTRWEVPFALACMGLRRGEICAVKDTDLDGNILHVQHAMTHTPDGFWEMKEPKTPTSNRYVPIPENIANQIRERGYAWHGTPNAMSDSFRYLLHKAGIEHFRLHDCRHFFASYGHDVLKLSDAQIMKLGGWSTDHVMKRVYIAAISDESMKMCNEIDKLLG